jgi:multiple sugar transport system ATP-binding protein
VQLIEQTGHENIVVVRVGDELRMTGRTNPEQTMRAGDSIWLRIDANQAHFFAEGATGKRLNSTNPASNGPATKQSALKEATS